MPKKLFIKTYGCQMNVYDSDRMADALAPHGYEPTTDIGDADLVVLNTCHIREKASEKVFSELGRLREMREERRAMGEDFVIGVAGCVAQAEGEEIVRRMPGRRSRVRTAVLSPPARDAGARRATARSSIPTSPPRTSSSICRPRRTKSRSSAASPPSSPCRKAATSSARSASCPTRAAPKSRDRSRRCWREAENLVAAGVMELTLLGQNVNAYHGLDARGRAVGLGELCRRLAEIPGLARIRYTTSHPRDMDDDLLAAHRDVDKLMPYLHLPVQSGSDRILEAMNRRHTRADYLADHRAHPRCAAGHRALGRFHRRLPRRDRRGVRGDALDRPRGRLRLGLLPSSTRPAPVRPARCWTIRSTRTVKVERLARLNAEILTQQIAFAKSCEGRILPVLIEKPGRMPGQLGGRSPYLQAVHMDGPARLIGTIQPG